MELQEARDFSRLARVVRNVVGREPEFVRPNIDKEHRDEARQVEDILFDRNRLAQGRGRDSKRCARVRETEEPMGEEKIQPGAARDQNRQSPPESLPRDLHAFVR